MKPESSGFTRAPEGMVDFKDRPAAPGQVLPRCQAAGQPTARGRAASHLTEVPGNSVKVAGRGAPSQACAQLAADSEPVRW